MCMSLSSMIKAIGAAVLRGRWPCTVTSRPASFYALDTNIASYILDGDLWDKRPLDFLHYHPHLAMATARTDFGDLKNSIPLTSSFELRRCVACWNWAREGSQAPPHHNSYCGEGVNLAPQSPSHLLRRWPLKYRHSPRRNCVVNTGMPETDAMVNTRKSSVHRGYRGHMGPGQVGVAPPTGPSPEPLSPIRPARPALFKGHSLVN